MCLYPHPSKSGCGPHRLSILREIAVTYLTQGKFGPAGDVRQGQWIQALGNQNGTPCVDIQQATIFMGRHKVVTHEAAQILLQGPNANLALGAKVRLLASVLGHGDFPGPPQARSGKHEHSDGGPLQRRPQGVARRRFSIPRPLRDANEALSASRACRQCRPTEGCGGDCINSANLERLIRSVPSSDRRCRASSVLAS